MTLTPIRATIDFKTNTSQTTLGCKDVKIVDKVTMKDITADSDAAIKRFPTINDADFSATFVEDFSDAGQDLIRAAKANHTPYVYVVTKGGAIHTLTAYVESISRPSGPADEQLMEVTFSVSGGVVTTGT